MFVNDIILYIVLEVQSISSHGIAGFNFPEVGVQENIYSAQTKKYVIYEM